MKELVSIAMATYDGSSYLEEQLDSIYRQTYKNFEIIIVDDNSNDDTTKILDHYANMYGLKYIVNHENMGVVKSFEKAVNLCKGEYILLADQDDVWLPEKIDVLYKNIGTSSLIYSNALIINEESKSKEITAKDLYPRIGLDSNSKDIYKRIVLGSFILGCSIMFKRELLPSLLPIYKSQRNHDWWLTVCAYKNSGITYVDEVLFYYRHHDKNYSRNGKKVSFIQKVLDFYSKERNYDRRKNVIEQCEIVCHLHNGNMYLNKDDENFLVDMKKYCTSFLNTKFHFRAFIIASKYEKYMFLSKNKFENKLHLFSRLIG